MATMHPISVRLAAEVDRPLRMLARRTRRPLGRLINDLLDQSLRMQRFPGVLFVQGPSGPIAHLAGTGLDVWEAVMLHREHGSAERVAELFPSLAPHALDVALAYAAAYPDEIDDALRENERPVDDVLGHFPHIRKLSVT